MAQSSSSMVLDGGTGGTTGGTGTSDTYNPTPGTGSGSDPQDSKVIPSPAPSEGTALNMQNTLDFYRVKYRDLYKYQGRTFNQINIPIIDGVYTAITTTGASGFSGYAGSSLSYTAPDSTYSPWVDTITLGGGCYTNKNAIFTESDYWSDPRFNSNCHYAAEDGNLGEYTIIYRKESDNHLWIASTSQQGVEDEMWEDDVDLGGNTKWVLILAAGGGGGGAAGYYYVRTTNLWEYRSAGGGGGGGACAFVAAKIGDISTSATPAAAYQKNCLLIVRGTGGKGGTKSTGYTENVPESISADVWGSDGAPTRIYLYNSGVLSKSITIPGGGGGGKTQAYDSGKAVSYNVSYKAGAGGTFDGSAYQTGSLRVLHKSSSSDYAVSDGASGSAGRYEVHTGTGSVWDSDYSRNIAFNASSGTHSDDDYGKDGNSVSSISARLKTKSSSTVSNILYKTEDHCGGLNTYSFRFWNKETAGDASTISYFPHYGGAGGASALGNGGGYARDTSYYCDNQACVYNDVKPKYGGGGTGGCVTTIDVYGAKGTPREGQDGADGYVGIWYPDPLLTTTPRAETFRNPQLSAEYKEGVWAFHITNHNSFSVICHRRHTYEDRDYIDDTFEMDVGETYTETDDFDGDTVYVFFSVDGVINASEVISHTFDSDESTQWDEN